MCRKVIYYNTYADGAQDVTERFDTCHPGRICSHPEMQHLNRTFHVTKRDYLSSKESAAGRGDRKSAIYHTSRRSDMLLPPQSRSKSPSPSRKRDSGVYVDGIKIANVSKKRHSTASHGHHEDRYVREHVVVMPQAPEPPSPRPSMKRSNTMPDFVVIEDRGRRSCHHQHRPSRSPQPVAYPVDDREERRRRRAERRNSVVVVGGEPPHKELRWEDEVQAQIAAQNERIARRPKPQLHQELKGILKKSNTTTDIDADMGGDAVRDLGRAVEKMDIRSGKKAEERRERETRTAEDMYWDRLRNRFEEPTERRRHSRAYYPGENVYRYM